MTSWQPISEAPKRKTPMIVVRGVLASGYVTDPWAVWWDDIDCEWVRWPHKEPPTHFCELPEFAP